MKSDLKETMLTLRRQCKPSPKRSVGIYNFKITTRIIMSLSPAEATDNAEAIIKGLEPIWNGASTLRVQQCFALFLKRKFRNLYGQHLVQYAPQLKPLLTSLLSNPHHGDPNYQVVCYDLYRTYFLEGSSASERQSFYKNYAQKLRSGLASRSLHVKELWLIMLKYPLFKKAALPVVHTEIPDFRKQLSTVVVAKWFV